MNKLPPAYTLQRDATGRPVALCWSAQQQRAADARHQERRQREEAERLRFAAPMAGYVAWAKERGLKW